MTERCTIDELVARVRAVLGRVAPEDLAAEIHAGALVIDVRPADQRARDGALPGAIVVDRNVLEWRLDPASPDRLAEVTGYDQRIIVVCDEGYGSSLAAASLHGLGLHRATDLIGGYQAWRAGTQEPIQTNSSTRTRMSSRSSEHNGHDDAGGAANVKRFTERYRLCCTPPMIEVEGQALGSDYGSTGYTTRDQADDLAVHLQLRPGDRLADIGAGSGWPGLYLADKTGCQVVGTDLPSRVCGVPRRALQMTGSPDAPAMSWPPAAVSPSDPAALTPSCTPTSCAVSARSSGYSRLPPTSPAGWSHGVHNHPRVGRPEPTHRRHDPQRRAAARGDTTAISRPARAGRIR